jgi:hypothetical protein
LEGRVLPSADVLTWHNDAARTGLYADETQLTPRNVSADTFGKLFVLPADGKVDAAPLFKPSVLVPGAGLHNVVFVASEHDTVYAYDANGLGLLWQVSLLGEGEVPSDNRGCGLVAPEIGITSTPVIDPSTDVMYVVAASMRVAGTSTTYYERLHALDVGTGLDVLPPATIDESISFPGRGPGGDGTHVFFDPKQYLERDALLLANGQVYVLWGSHCDLPPFTGWVMTFSAADLSLTGVLNVNPNGAPTSQFLGDGSGDAFWNGGAGPAADPAGDVYNITSNGPFDEQLDANGFPVSQDYGDSDIKVAFSPAGGLRLTDYWTPFNQQALAEQDMDTGSSGILVLPGQTDAAGRTRHLAVGSGKDGNLYLVDRDDMGKFVPDSNSSIYQEVRGAIGPAFSAPAYFNGKLYFGGVNDVLKAYQLTNARLGASPTSRSTNRFPYPGATPSVSANGTADGIVWAAENGTTANPAATLHAYDANNLANELYNSNQAGERDHFGTGNKFITPVIADGKVFVGTTAGVGVFGLFSAPVSVNLSSASNVEGETADGVPFGSGGLDGNGYAISADLLAGGQVWRNTPFYFWAGVGGPNVVSAAGQTVGLPVDSWSAVRLLATGVNGNHPNLTFTVTYTDGSADTYARSVSEWLLPQGYAGESVAAVMPYRNYADGSQDSTFVFVYGYELALAGDKAVQSITLPSDSGVMVLGVTVAYEATSGGGGRVAPPTGGGALPPESGSSGGESRHRGAGTPAVGGAFAPGDRADAGAFSPYAVLGPLARRKATATIALLENKPGGDPLADAVTGS